MFCFATIVFNTRVISRATVSAVSCLVVPAFICIDLLISLVLKINDDADDDDDDHPSDLQTVHYHHHHLFSKHVI